MRIRTLRLKNFQSFGPDPTEIELNQLTFVLGPNGAGKTAVLVALARLFSPLPALRRVQPEDFHVPATVNPDLVDNELWIEVDIEFAEAADEGETHPSIPAFFTHMAMEAPAEPPRVRVRLTAILDADGYIDEKIEYITQVDANGEPMQRSGMSRHDRAFIEVHYLPARRDPVDHIAYTTASLLGRMLRAADWTHERSELARLTKEISTMMASNDAVMDIGAEIQKTWAVLHKGVFFKDPAIAFGRGEIEGVLRQLTVIFAPGPAGDVVSFERLSDGQKSLLYISLVLAWQGIARKVLSGEEVAFDPDRLRPPVHIVIALEEPENSLAPHYLGRIVRQLREASDKEDVQGVVATHAPALLHRAEPEDIRFLRLAEDRTTTVRTITMPSDTDEAAKYVREAVLAYPELYFARLVVLGEGDSEQIVLPRVLAAAGIAEDDVSVCVVPLGGRHVNHFWRLLEHLDIPYITLLDLDCGRHRGGWGRVSYAAKQLNKFRPGTFKDESVAKIPAWDDDCDFPRFGEHSGLRALERRGVFFSYPLDLDLMLLEAYPDAYDVKAATPNESTKEAVLGKARANVDRLDDVYLQLFDEYQRQFKQGSKPASHIAAMSKLTDEELVEDLPEPLMRLVDALQKRLESIPE
ncbi:TOPRIM nucleotidyl transferase/hydrolase domain-containing protein [Actinomyces sp. 565]|uniref:ATP-dependent nuclease n=1 Tax=Actinomyces sp. 565 TaxID=2057794 RepID=UPI0013A6F4E1|nr:TOPRIM nucleotidyl transferase/hydrolase domain-containing protein [Actinomyces sp. 565]NDR54428.1 AAA family ATPase [Actinomyces sp. 565]